MNKNTFENYLEEIILRYNIEKKGTNSPLLLDTTRARLRDLCIEKFRKNTNKNDIITFNLFMGFEFNLNSLNKIRENTDKFRRIETFFKGETVLSDIEGADMAAILVDFKFRPFSNYREVNVIKTPITPNDTVSSKPPDSHIPKSKNLTWIKKNLVYIAIGITLFTGIFLGINTFMNSEKSIEWVNDHYEEVESNNEQENRSQFLINEKLLTTFKKITPCDTTKYKKNGIVCLWYGKSSRGKIEFFTALDRHPETGKTLKEVTPYIMNKYGKGPCE